MRLLLVLLLLLGDLIMFNRSLLLQSTIRRTLFRSSSSIVKSISYNKNGHNNNRFLPTMFIAVGISTSVALQMQSGSEGSEDADKFSNTALYPMGPLLEKGMLQVNDKHNISFSVYGNPKGKAALFIHGGPGGGCSPEMSRFFDPQQYKIILVDQRGCGNSTPFADLDQTTFDLVDDFEKIRKKLGIDKWLVFGGSWGSTLSLTYAIKHPERVTELVLRGIFLLRKKEIDW